MDETIIKAFVYGKLRNIRWHIQMMIESDPGLLRTGKFMK